MILINRALACRLALGVTSLGVWTAPASAQAPPIPPMPTPILQDGQPLHHCGPGPIGGAVQHVGVVLKDNLIGYPEYFVRPPLGTSLSQNFGSMKSNANMHTFILYRSDFVAETGTLTPAGASRLNRMLGKLHKWPGPVVIERVPDRPGLAEMRRESLINSIGYAGHYVDPGRVLVGGSPYDGLYGDMASANYTSALFRQQAASIALPLPPLPVAQIQPAQ